MKRGGAALRALTLSRVARIEAQTPESGLPGTATALAPPPRKVPDPVDVPRAVTEDARVDPSREIAAQAAHGGPAVRAKFLQLWLHSLERFDPAAAHGLGPLVGEPKLRAVFQLSMLSWVPIELDIEIVEAVAEILGPTRFTEFTRAYVAEIMPRPPLGALIDLGTKMIGVSPESFLRWWDKGWNAVYRGCGKVKGSVVDGAHGHVVYEQMPRACVESDAFVDAVVSTAYTVYAWTNRSGVVRVAARDVARGYLELELSWHARG